MTLFGKIDTVYTRRCELIAVLYNRYAKRNELPIMRKLTQERRNIMEGVATLSDTDLRLFYEECKKSVQFFKSFNGFSFDWLMHNYIKVMEGKYRAKETETGIKSEITYKQREF